MRFLIDVDDVLADASPAIQEAMRKATGRVVPIRDWHEYDLHNIYGVDYAVLQHAIIHHFDISALEPIAGAMDATRLISDVGGRSVIVTSRGAISNALDLTHDWLTRKNFVFDRILIPEQGSPKSSVYHSGNSEYAVMIDDHAAHLKDAEKTGCVIKTLLIDRPWNRQHHEYVMGVNRFSDIYSAVCSVLDDSVARFFWV